MTTFNARVKRNSEAAEFLTPERCYMLEVWNEEDEELSLARARVEPGVTTQRHSLEGTSERYLITDGSGVVEVEGLPPTRVVSGDVVYIPPGSCQRITNDGGSDLVFYCVCTPRFAASCYANLE